VADSLGGEELSGDDLVAAFGRWAADERVTLAAESRSRQRRISEAAFSSATWAGVLVDLAEAGEPLVLVVGSRRLSCVIVGVGLDFCVVESEGAPPSMVALRAILSVWPSERRISRPAGDRGPALRLSFAAALAVLAEERLPVALWIGDERVEGDLLAVGEDVATVRTPPPARRVAHLSLSAISACELR
jgi:hypothetical protein